MSARKKMVFGLGALALATGFCAAQPAKANDLERFLNGLRGGPSYYAPGYRGYYGGPDYAYDANGLASRISNRLDRGFSDGRLTRHEFNILRRELNAIMADRPVMDYATFRSRLITLNSRVTSELNDREFAGRGFGHWY